MDITATTQFDAVLEIFQEHKTLTSSQVQQLLLQHGWDLPVGSVRRAITQLKELEYLEDTGDRVKSIHTKPLVVWRYKEVEYVN